MWRPNNMLLNGKWINSEIKEEIEKILENNENEHTTAQNLWDTAKAVLRGPVIVLQAYPKIDRKISNKQLNPTSTRTGGPTTNKAQSQQKEGNNQDQRRIK